MAACPSSLYVSAQALAKQYTWRQWSRQGNRRRLRMLCLRRRGLAGPSTRPLVPVCSVHCPDRLKLPRQAFRIACCQGCAWQPLNLTWKQMRRSLNPPLIGVRSDNAPLADALSLSGHFSTVRVFHQRALDALVSACATPRQPEWSDVNHYKKGGFSLKMRHGITGPCGGGSIQKIRNELCKTMNYFA